MARGRLDDLMQVYPFWVFDASGPESLLFPAFDPTLGFSSITAPEISIEMRDVQRGNWEYKTRVVKTADVSPIVFARGARFFDSDFYNWIVNAIRGVPPVRKSLVLVHFLGLRSGGPDTAAINAAVGASIGAASAGTGGAIAGAGIGVITGATGGGAPGAGEIGVGPEQGITSLAERVPARAWMLHDCVPTRYRAGTDFDATSGAVSIMELEVQPDYVSELTTTTLSPVAGRVIGIASAF